MQIALLLTLAVFRRQVTYRVTQNSYNQLHVEKTYICTLHKYIYMYVDQCSVYSYQLHTVYNY